MYYWFCIARSLKHAFHMEYLCGVAPTYKTHLQPLYVTQKYKYVLRTIARKSKLHSWPLFLEYKIYPIRHLFVLKALKFHVKNGSQTMRPSASYYDRRREQFLIPFPHSELFRLLVF